MFQNFYAMCDFPDNLLVEYQFFHKSTRKRKEKETGQKLNHGDNFGNKRVVELAVGNKNTASTASSMKPKWTLTKKL